MLTTFQHKGQKYYVVQPLEPFVLVGRQVGGAQFEVPQPSEMMRVGPTLEHLMQQSLVQPE